jgi:hypothetical protein
VFKKNISDGVGSRNESIGTPLYPPLFWLDNIFNAKCMHGNVLFLWSIKNAESKFVEMGFEKCSRENSTAKNLNIMDFCTFALFSMFYAERKHILSP